jgi:hypothetical protein
MVQKIIQLQGANIKIFTDRLLFIGEIMYPGKKKAGGSKVPGW